MAQVTTKEKETTAVTVHRPTEILPRRSDIDRWFDRLFENFWRRPFPSLWRSQRWWPFDADITRGPAPAVDV